VKIKMFDPTSGQLQVLDQKCAIAIADSSYLKGALEARFYTADHPRNALIQAISELSIGRCTVGFPVCRGNSVPAS
jgi:hypothetical protein